MSSLNTLASTSWMQRAATLWTTRPTWLGGRAVADGGTTRTVRIHEQRVRFTRA